MSIASMPVNTAAEMENSIHETIVNRNYYDETPPSEIVDSEDEVLHLSPIWPNQEPVVAVIGVGYVGEHLVHAFASHCKVIGFDVSAARIQTLLAENTTGAFFTSKASDMAPATHFLIAVPTLLLPNQQVDSSYLRQAIAVVAKYARPGSTVVIESSVAVGMTRSLLGPVAAEKGFLAGMSPERVDPGRTVPPARAIPKVVSGLDTTATEAIAALYSRAFDTVVRVSRPEVAEMMKLYENCQRMVCIAYANEMADACAAHAIDPFEVCGAATTKPFGYMPFAPGLGVGGHCIPVNPFYLLSNSDFPLLQRATDRMRARPGVLAQRIVDKLRGTSGRSGGDGRLRVLIAGIGFKPGQSHLANSPSLELAKSLVVSGEVDVAWADPLVAQKCVPQIARLDEEQGWTEALLKSNFDYIVAAMQQTGLDFGVLHALPPTMVEWWFDARLVK